MPDFPDPNKTEEQWLKEVQEAVAQMKDLKSMSTQEIINFAENSVNDYWGVNDLVMLNIFLVRHLQTYLNIANKYEDRINELTDALEYSLYRIDEAMNVLEKHEGEDRWAGGGATAHHALDKAYHVLGFERPRVHLYHEIKEAEKRLLERQK